jgi:signal transduction histidine kinase
MLVNVPQLEPVGDVVAVVSLTIAFVLACLDCHLRQDRRPLPMVVTTAALAILWGAHLAASSGVVPGVQGPIGRATASWIFLVTNLVAPSLLAASLLHRPGHVESCWVIVRSMTLGILIGLAGVAGAWLGAPLPAAGNGGELSVPSAVGGLGLLPVGLAALLLLRGHSGDQRVLWSTLLGLGLTGLSAILMAGGPEPASAVWAVAQVLGVLVAVALLAGMLGLYPQSVRAEQDVQRERVVLLNRALEASDAERRRIARDLHDSAVQDLAAVSFSLAGTSRRVASEGRRDLAKLLDEAAGATRQTMAGLRSLIVDIYPPNLHKEGIEAALADLCAAARSRGLSVEFQVTPGLSLSEQAAETVYRIAQEAVRNALRHSRARALTVSLIQKDGQVCLEVADDGRGFDGQLATANGHFGLRLVSDLAREVGGNLEITSRPGQGAVVRLEMAS